jgi:hypothetical protein
MLSFRNHEPRPQCVAPGCPDPATAEVLQDRPRDPKKLVRRVRIFACERHMRDPDLNERLGGPEWQRLLFVRPKEGRQ